MNSRPNSAKNNMTKFTNYAHIKPILRELISDVIQISSSRWRIDWGCQKPNMGTHYYYNEIEQANSFKSVKAELLKFPNLLSKYPKNSIEKPIFSFIDIVLLTCREKCDQVK